MTSSDKELLNIIKSTFGAQISIHNFNENGRMHIILKSPNTENDIEVFYDNELLVVSIGEWTHKHPESMKRTIELIDDIIKDKIIIWKITKRDQGWYSGHYHVDEYAKQPEMVDEPFTYLEDEDLLELSTFNRIIKTKEELQQIAP